MAARQIWGQSAPKVDHEELALALSRVCIPANPPDVVFFIQGVSPVGGQGCFASRYIPAGTPILSEAPLLSVIEEPNGQTTLRRFSRELGKLGQPEQAQFRALNHIGPLGQGGQAQQDHQRFKQNSFGIIRNGSRPNKADGLFIQISRFNHSCVSNACHRWDKDTQRMKIYAVGSIEHGDEIFLNYIATSGNSADSHYRLRIDRDGILNRSWGFTCNCCACDSTSQFGQESERRRQEMQELRGQIDNNSSLPGDVETLIDLCIQENLRFPELCEAYRFAADSRVQSAEQSAAQGNTHQDYWSNCIAEALIFARRGLDGEIICTGYDSPEVQGTLNFIRDLKMHPRKGLGFVGVLRST